MDKQRKVIFYFSGKAKNLNRVELAKSVLFGIPIHPVEPCDFGRDMRTNPVKEDSNGNNNG